jgi:hypothetical protein
VSERNEPLAETAECGQKVRRSIAIRRALHMDNMEWRRVEGSRKDEIRREYDIAIM